MQFKSEAQRKKFAELVSQGKITQAESDKWNKETGSRKLPDRLKQKPKHAKGGRR